MFKRAALRSALVAAAWSILVSTYAHADPKWIDVPPGDLTVALESLAKQLNVELVYQTEQLKGLRTQGASGNLSPQEAVTKLLQGTPLRVRTDSTGAMLIAPPLHIVGPTSELKSTGDQDRDAQDAKAKARADAVGTNENDWRALRLAQENTPDPGQSASVPEVENSSERAVDLKEHKPEEIIVTGSRLADTGENQSQPIRSYTREDIQKSGRTTIADFLSTLPDVSVSSTEGGFQQFLGQTTVQLHGLPVGTTLVLLNGRRLESSFLGFFDLSSIPAWAVERIDVLPVGSSAIYGSDALAGAMNIILRRNLNGAELDVNQGHAYGSNETNVNASYGLGGERGSIGFIATYQHREELFASDRAATSTTALPADAPNLFDVCSPGNIYSLDGTPLPGLGTATQAGIPAGLTGRPSTQAFLATAGTVNRCNSVLYNGLIPPTKRVSALLVANYRLSDAADLFLETLASQEDQFSQDGYSIELFGGSFGAQTLGAQNPFNPFGKAVGISYTDLASGRVGYDFKHDFMRPLVGIRGTVFSNWEYELTTAYSKDRTPYDHPQGNSAAIQAALDSADPATALNPFASGPSGTPRLLQSIRDSAQHEIGLITDQATIVQAWIRGPLINMPTGAVQSVLGAEYSSEKERASDNLFATNVGLQRRSFALFSEARIPLLADTSRVGIGKLLALNIAARYDHSDDFGGKATWQTGLVWRSNDEWLFRGGYAVSYKAPQLQQIGGGIQGTFMQSGLVDPLRGNEPVNGNVLVSFGGNPDLKAETGRSRALGIVYSSRQLAGFRAELTQFDIELNNYISSPPLQALVDNANIFQGGVVRAPPSVQDVQKGFLGPITALNDLYFNFGELRVSGVNLDLSYRATTTTGEWMPAITVSNIYKWLSALSPGSGPVSYLGQATLAGPGFAPRWKGTAALAWHRGPLGASVSGRYLGRYADYQDLVPNRNELGNSWTYDANLHIDLGKVMARNKQWLAGVSLDVGAVNLFDRAPPFSYSGVGYDYAEYDIRGRFVYAHLATRF